MRNENLIKVICKIFILKICDENFLLYKRERIDQSLVVEKYIWTKPKFHVLKSSKWVKRLINKLDLLGLLLFLFYLKICG